MLGYSFNTKVSYAQNARSVTENRINQNINAIRKQQNQISQRIQQSANQRFKGFKRLSKKDIAISFVVDRMVREHRPVDVYNEAEIRKTYAETNALKAEADKIQKEVAEKRLTDREEAFARIESERQAEADKIKAELQEKLEQYFKDAKKNLPPKGKHIDYSDFNNSFTPLPKGVKHTDYSDYNSSFKPIIRK